MTSHWEESEKIHQSIMKLAVDAANIGIKLGLGGPFGCVIVKNNKVIAVACNTVLRDKDATHHAEINAIRLASEKLKTWDLTDCTLYTTTEPCPMCTGACHWARIKRIYYGTTIDNVGCRGFNELSVSAEDLLLKGLSETAIRQLPNHEDCETLLENWEALDDKKRY